MNRHHYDETGKPKRAFTTWQAALDASSELATKNNEVRPVNAYRCKGCGLFHIGHTRTADDVSEEQKVAQLVRSGWYPVNQRQDRWVFGNTHGKLEPKKARERGVSMTKAYKSMLRGKRIQQVGRSRRWRPEK